jgi:putative transposase
VHLSTYYAAKSRPPSKRAVEDVELLVEIRRVFESRQRGRRLHGARKVCRQLHRDGITVGRCRVER